MTLAHKFNQGILKMYVHTKIKFLAFTMLEHAQYRHTHTHTHTHTDTQTDTRTDKTKYVTTATFASKFLM